MDEREGFDFMRCWTFNVRGFTRCTGAQTSKNSSVWNALVENVGAVLKDWEAESVVPSFYNDSARRKQYLLRPGGVHDL